jgi:hypothetical protein
MTTARARLARTGARSPARWRCGGAVLCCIAIAAGTGSALGQPRPQTPPQSPRDSAPFEIAGNWVAIVNEDWRWRMLTPPKGDYSSLTMLNPEGRAAADAWDPATDGSCKAYGAAALLRMPTRLRIHWESDTVLALETDAGRQRRSFRFAEPAAPGELGPPSLQGVSTAHWRRRAAPIGGVIGAPAGPPPPGGSLEVATINLLPGWLRRNGVPYSGQTTVTEWFDAFESPNGDDWLIVTTVVEDPIYLSDRYVTSSHFKRERDGSKWNPTACRSE